MPSLPDLVRTSTATRPRSLAEAVGPFLGYAPATLSERRLEDAALIVLASVWARQGTIREQLLTDRLVFDRLVYAVNRCPVRRGGDD